MSLAVASDATPSLRYPAPGPRAPSPGWWPGRRGRLARPSLRDVLARRGDPRGIPGNSAGDRRRPAGRGRIRRGGRAGRRPGAGVLVTAMPRFRCRPRHRGDAAEPGGNPSSTGHVWITIWRRYGRDPFRIFLPPSLPTASVLVTGGGAARVCGHVPWRGIAIRRICTVHRRVLYTASYTRDLAGAGVIGACSHAGPAAARFPVPVCVQLSERGSSPEPRRVWTGKTRRIDPILQVMTGWPWPARARPRPAAGRRRQRPSGLLRAVPRRGRGPTGNVGRLMPRAHDAGRYDGPWRPGEVRASRALCVSAATWPGRG